MIVFKGTFYDDDKDFVWIEAWNLRNGFSEIGFSDFFVVWLRFLQLMVGIFEITGQKVWILQLITGLN